MKISALIVVFIATLVHCYDYALFGLAAATLAKNFLPAADSGKQLSSFFAIFSVAVLARPIGAIIFGAIGDSKGRVESVRIATSLAAISTSIIAVLPSFSSIGWTATAVLAFCRMSFLISLAGEIDAAKIYIVEKMGKNRKNLASGLVTFYSQLGAVLAAISYHLASSSSNPNLWRLNFAFGGVAGILIILMQKYFQESEQFLNFKVKHSSQKPNYQEIISLIKTYKSKFFLTMLISGCSGGVYHFLIIFFSTFAVQAAHLITTTEARLFNIYLIMIYAVSAMLSGFMADKSTPIRQAILALVISLIVSSIALVCDISLLFYVVGLLVSLLGFYIVPLHPKLQSIFHISIRMRMCSLAHSIGSFIFSSSIPFFCILVWNMTNSLSLVFSVLILLLAIILGGVIYLNFYHQE